MNKTIILLLCIVFLLSSCNGTETQPNDINYKTGYGGLDLQILPQYPPRTVFEGTSTSIGIRISNRGAYTVSDGRIAIIGLNQVASPLVEDEKLLQILSGRSLGNSEGDFYVEEFQTQELLVPAGAQEYRAKFFVLAEYDYQSTLSTDVCINPEILTLEKSQTCTPQERQSFGGQGSPVAISSVEQRVQRTNDQLISQFIFTIENRGGGELASPVRIADARLGPRLLHCDKRELLERDIKNKKNQIVCSTTEPIEDSYKTTLSASLFYTYRKTILGEFTIKKRN